MFYFASEGRFGAQKETPLMSLWTIVKVADKSFQRLMGRCIALVMAVGAGRLRLEILFGYSRRCCSVSISQ